MHVNGPVTTGTSSAIRVLQVNNVPTTTLTVAAGFTNHGQLDLSSRGEPRGLRGGDAQRVAGDAGERGGRLDPFAGGDVLGGG